MQWAKDGGAGCLAGGGPQECRPYQPGQGGVRAVPWHLKSRSQTSFSIPYSAGDLQLMLWDKMRRSVFS